MKKLIFLLTTLLAIGMIFWSCSDDDGGTEPSNESPTCTITLSADSSTFVIGDSITVKVDADDPDGTISEVRFYFDSDSIGFDTTSPCSLIIF